MTVSQFALAAATLHTLPSLIIRNGRRTLETKGTNYTEGDVAEIDGEHHLISKVSYDGVVFSPYRKGRKR